MDEIPIGISIGEVVRRSGVPASTLRYYEERGLITSVGRRGLARVFAPAVLGQLALIAVCRNVGFSLDEITRMLSRDVSNLDRSMLAAKADELDAMVQRMTLMRDQLRHAAACQAPSHMECPTFQRMLREAGSDA